MGMDNNPTLLIDSDGGCTDCTQCPDACADLKIENISKGQSTDLNLDGYFMRDDLASLLLSAANLGTQINVKVDGLFGQARFWLGTDVTMGDCYDGMDDAVDRLLRGRWNCV